MKKTILTIILFFIVLMGCAKEKPQTQEPKSQTENPKGEQTVKQCVDHCGNNTYAVTTVIIGFDVPLYKYTYYWDTQYTNSTNCIPPDSVEIVKQHEYEKAKTVLDNLKKFNQ